MKIELRGITRIVFVFNRFVIKIPNFTNCHHHFLIGCMANWQERDYYKRCALIKDSPVAPSYFCLWFGLLQVQAKCEPRTTDLSIDEIEKFKDVQSQDIKKENFGYYQGRLVCFDYA